jgi:hypothetical protein
MRKGFSDENCSTAKFNRDKNEVIFDQKLIPSKVTRALLPVLSYLSDVLVSFFVFLGEYLE